MDAMKKLCDVYLLSDVQGNKLPCMPPNYISIDPAKIYTGYLNMSLNRIKCVAVVSKFRRHGLICYGAPIKYRDVANVTVETAFSIAVNRANSLGCVIQLPISCRNSSPPVFWSFKLNCGADFVGGAVAVDRLDGHVWSEDEVEEYMYDYNNIF
jgi:hypothetical protein